MGVLVERDTELEALTALAAAPAGHLALVEGPPGIGKTTLLGALVQRAAAGGATVLRARGAELERGFAFGVAQQLLEPVLVRLPAVARRRVLSGAAAPAGALLAGGGAQAEGTDAFPLLHALYWACANLAGDQPLVLVVDDAQWADDASLSWLGYLNRRRDELRALLVLALRPDAAGAPAPLQDLRGDRDARVLALRPLSEPASAAVLADAFAAEPESSFVHACHDATGGNPLYLTELARTLAAEGVAPHDDAAARIDHIRPETIARGLLVRLAALGEPATRLARAVAVLGPDAALPHAAALAGLTEDDALTAAERLAAAGILQPERPLRFAHPIVGTAIDGELSDARRAAEHLRAAELLHAAREPDERVAAHLQLAEPGRGLGWAAESLRRAARRAVSRAAMEAAADHLDRALREPPAPELRAEVLRELGAAELRCGRPAAIEHLRGALDAAAGDRAAIARELASALLVGGRARDAIAVLDAELARSDDEQARFALESHRLTIGQFDPALGVRVTPALDREADALPGATPAERVLLANVALSDLMAGGDPERCRVLAERALAGGELLADDSPDTPGFYLAISALVDTEAYDLIGPALDRALDDARGRGSLLGFAVAASLRAHLCHLRGDLGAGEADARLALQAAQDSGFLTGLPLPAAALLDLLVDRGALAHAEALIVDEGLGGELPEVPMYLGTLWARARVRLAQGRREDALADFLELRSRQEAGGYREYRHLPRAGAALALNGLGRRDEALELAAAQLICEPEMRMPRPRGMALRALGLVTGGEAGIEHLREAVSVLESSPSRLEHARALLDLGAALRRANARAESREPLRQALDAAHRMEATALAQQAEEELRAAGGRPRHIMLSGVESLTASELRIAQMAAQGMSNPEIAQALFVTRKTVEKHLGGVYRKLDVASRAELADVLGDQSSDSASAAARSPARTAPSM